MRLPRYPAFLAATFTLVAGCTSGPAPAAPAPTATGPAGLDMGALLGWVLDSELHPIAGAQVAMGSGAADPVRTEESGSFMFPALPPGRDTVYVAAIGYQAAARAVEIRAGETTQLSVSLEPLSATEPYSALEIRDGFIACGTGTGAEGIGGFTQVSCGSADPNQAFLFNYPIGPRLAGILFEMAWTPTQALSRDLVLIIEKDGCTVACEANDTFAQFQGCCYLRVPLRIDDLAKPEGMRPATDLAEGGPIQSRTFPAFGEEGSPVTVFTGQSFRLYVEYHYNGLPADWETRTNVPE